MAADIQGLNLKFNLYLLILFNDTCSSNIELILSKNNALDRFTSYWSNWRTSDQSLSE